MIQKLKYYNRVVGFSGMLQVLRSKLTHSSELIKIERDDCKAPIWLRFPASDIPTYEQVFMTYEYDFKVDAPPAVILDAGANIGLASVLFANKYPDAKIIAVEPEQNNFEILLKNVAPYPNITAMRGALWHRNTEIDIFNPGRGDWGFVTKEDDKTDAEDASTGQKVRAMTVDKIIEEFGLGRINILKIDIEGAEREVFSDTASWIDDVDSVIVELHEYASPGCSRSFYTGTPGFEHEWHQGENVYLSKGKGLIPDKSDRSWLK